MHADQNHRPRKSATVIGIAADPSGRPRMEPDPVGHARLLIRELGLHAAMEIAQVYAQGWPAGAYWPRILQALETANVRIAERGVVRG